MSPSGAALSDRHPSTFLTAADIGNDEKLMNRTALSIFVLLILAMLPGCHNLFLTGSVAFADLEVLGCGVTECTKQMFLCVLDPDCREALECNAACSAEGGRAEQQACNLVCQLTQGGNSERYGALVQCFAENGCLPALPEGTDGRCLVTSENIDKVHVLESLEELEGTWLEVRGRNCGVPGSGWEGGYDALPCRASSWVFNAGQWWYHTSFCAPAEDGQCGEEGPVHLIAEPRRSDITPGLIDVVYTNPPLKPQEERWYILSKPHPDWIMYNYCGSTPAGEYAGVNVMTRAPEASDSTMPPEVDAAFRQAAADFNFFYDDMCVTDQSQCPPVTAEEDVQDWVDCPQRSKSARVAAQK